MKNEIKFPSMDTLEKSFWLPCFPGPVKTKATQSSLPPWDFPGLPKIASPKSDVESEEAKATDMVKCLLAALSTTPKTFAERLFAKGQDYEIFNRVVSSILEAKEEKVLSEQETKVLVNFIASKLIEHRIDSLFGNLFQSENIGGYSIRGILGGQK